ncbi:MULTISPECIES: hypothetical protein [unclassified Curtobacterium]|uniref:hypothetical protein n=1 Tax=unclassified Curtobacterium TaxID=257496 RepID=UPI000F47591D|nr:MULTISPECIES: hypothetical protein [unclassified Curtobacterium]ROQ16232.1 hypothetical protein EDF41_0908 [Curtobacterium sp. PhB171]ROQ25692.1 hypothetical protein EDF40_2190 [Curtobacterium sp. PhB170]ROS37145.1 hypothetical protein EDF25_1367 [Curtobacterium sp. PhB131]ROS71820.1 hypothetical protein EDF30_1553 [Curtobacterium sp. PhB141]TCL80053.1 hypothetical protein EDF23_102446 [Curtobacterium sp. PhB128]
MTELAYMVRADWGQQGTGMTAQSVVIRDWLGPGPYVFAVSDADAFGVDDQDADAEAAGYLDADAVNRSVLSTRRLPRFSTSADVTLQTVVVLHPFEESDLEAIRKVADANSLRKLFILVWSGDDIVRTWLDGMGALNLHTRKTAGVEDSLLLAAAGMIKSEDYNGLSFGKGKDAVVQLVRAFAVEGYPVDPTSWLRAYFAVGGGFKHAPALQKIVQEMATGIRHRVKPRYRDNIVAILRDRDRDGDVGDE